MLKFLFVSMDSYLDFSKCCQSPFFFLQNINTELLMPQTAIPAKASHNQNGLSSPVFGVPADGVSGFGVYGFGVSFGLSGFASSFITTFWISLVSLTSNFTSSATR